MPHIEVPPGVPGIRSLFMAHPETGNPMSELAQVLLRGPSTLSPGERELIASRVSTGNQCVFCASSHSAAAVHLLDGDRALVAAVNHRYEDAPISAKLKALLAIADKVREDPRTVSAEDIEAARKHGATDDELHSTVLIAAAFCMYNRYVDGLASWTPTDPVLYDEMGKRLAREGYFRPTQVSAASAGARPVPAPPEAPHR